MKRDQQKRAVHKGGMEGNRWIEGVRQKQEQGWKEGIKRRGGGWVGTQRQIEIILKYGVAHAVSAGIGVAAYTTYTHTNACMLPRRPAGCLQ